MMYRPEIDGLRAIAIVLVLVYHGGLALFPSGFVGVDVFFVISGFLITSIIHHSLANNTFSLLTFYKRRLWRLQPVYVSLIFFTLVMSLCLFLPEDLMQYVRSARKASLFISNLYFKSTTTGYFAPDSHQLPLLHTWSLSIEWQCYLFLPLLMYGLHRLFPLKQLVFIVYGLMMGGLILALWSAAAHPAEVYFQFSSRLFEFLLGSCIVLTPIPAWKGNGVAINLLPIVCLLTLFYVASLDQILLGYPNGYALAVCLATVLLIALGQLQPKPLVMRWLSSKPMVFIGVLSYSLYIWHWVVFALLRYQSIDEKPIILTTAYGLTFLLAYFSWRFIEKPARAFHSMKFSYTLGILVISPVLLIHLSSYVINHYSGFPQRFTEELVTVYNQLNQYESMDRPLCISKDGIDINTHCKIGAKEQTSKRALLIGDSFSNHYWGFMDVLGKQANLSILAQGTSSCLTFPGIYLFDWWQFKNSVYQECRDQTERYYRMIRENHYDYVIIGQIWKNYMSKSVINHPGDTQSLALAKKRIRRAIHEGLQQIVDSGATPVFIKSTATLEKNQQGCFYKHIKLRTTYDSRDCEFEMLLSDSDKWFNQLFLHMQKKYPQLVVIDPKDIQCPNNYCLIDIKGVPVYRDEGHITDYASYQLGQMYLEQHENPFNHAPNYLLSYDR